MKKLCSNFRRFLREEEGMESGEVVMIAGIAGLASALIYGIFTYIIPIIKNLIVNLIKGGSWSGSES